MVRLFVIDSGTTNTRLRVMEDGATVHSISVRTGAADGPEKVRSAVSGLLRQAEHLPAEAAIFSGMITSPTGLLEIPHVPGPVDLANLRPLRHDLPEISGLPFYFIPGVRFDGNSPTEGDIIRGEETEIAGYLSDRGADGRRMFLHLGSHHKVMTVEGGRLIRSATAITGELFAAAAEHTLLRHSLELSDDVDPEWAMRGVEAARAEGLPRALFAVRLMDIRDHLPAKARASWALGAFAWEDFLLLKGQMDARPDELVIYGREGFGRTLKALAGQYLPGLPVVMLSHEESERLAPAGAWRAYQNPEVRHV